MKKPPQIRLNWIVLICIIALVVAILSDRTYKTRAPSPVVTLGTPVISSEYPFVGNEISQVVDDGTRIYVLCGDHDGIVQVYDMEGKYLNTMFFYDHMNGGFEIAADGSMFYVHDSQGNIYVFSNGDLATFVTYQENSEYLGFFSVRGFSPSQAYYEENGAIWRKDGGEAVCVIPQVLPNPTVDQKVFDILGRILVVILLCLVIYKHRTVNRTG